MRRILEWTFLLAGVTLGAAWILEGPAFVRRHFQAPTTVPEASRDQAQFMALLIPKLTPEGERLTISSQDFAGIASGLKEMGYTPIGLQEVEDFYRRRRLLPRQAVLIAFDQDYRRIVELADEVLRRLRWRGVLFRSHVAANANDADRMYLSPNGVRQMAEGGTWGFGQEGDAAISMPAPARLAASLIAEERSLANAPPPAYPLRFVASETGVNDASDDPHALHILRLRYDRTVAETLGIITRSWSRRKPFADDFESPKLGLDWAAAWGSVSTAHHRLSLIPLPGRTGAAVFLRGTERWRDLALEFVLRSYRKQAWAHARYKDNENGVRVGIQDGVWVAEQKTSPESLPVLLGSAALAKGELPARVRLVLKGEWAIVQVNGRMMFGKALRLDPSLDYGRLQFGVFDPEPRTAFAVLSSVRASPLSGAWLAVRAGAVEGDFLDRLREEAILASTISPTWATVDASGKLTAAARDDLVDSLAGFYHCRFVPMVDLSPAAVRLLASASGESLVRSLGQAGRDWHGAGLNLRLRSWDGWQPGAAEALGRLRRVLNSQGRRLWVTLDVPHSGAALFGAVDGVLTTSAGPLPGLDILRPLDGPAADGQEGSAP